MTYEELNKASQEDAGKVLRQCCTSDKWIAGLLARRPFAESSELSSAADEVWSELAEEDFLQAFDGHPKIGDVGSLKEKYANTKALAAGEQSSMETADDLVIAALAQGNEDYQRKFGFIFIVCATGKSAGEMLALLLERLPNTRDEELLNAAEEQRKIFQLRLEKLA